VSVDGIRIPRNVVSGRPITVRVTFRQNHIGRYEDRLELVFEDVQLKKRFTISRAVSAIVCNKVDHEALKPKAPYIPNIRADRSPVTNVIEGVAPPATTAIRFIGQLPAAKIPRGLLSVLLGPEGVRQQILHIQRAFLPGNVNGDTYGRLFKQLLWIEEFKMEYDFFYHIVSFI
jgi:helicase MOV-10